MNQDKVMSALSIAQKAGCVKSGGFAVEKAVKEGNAFLVIVTADASDNTKKKMKNMTDFYGVPLYVYSVKDDMGRQIGKMCRSMVAITQQGLAESIEKQLKLAHN